MKTLYFDCASGISGDMTVAALLDLGADEAALRAGLDSLNIGGYEIEISRVKKNGVDACDFNVVLESKHGREHHHHHGHGEEHEHRGLKEITAIIDASGITAGAKRMAKDIFTVIARAEGRVHGLAPDKVHFHEVGAVDSIVDIVGAAICVDAIAPDRIICSPLAEGTGSVRCQHGMIPVPVPATLEIVRERGIPLELTDNVGEMVTPTGAGIVALLAYSFGRPKAFTISAIGCGAGKKEFKSANLLRAMLLEEGSRCSDTAVLLECNLDDMTGEHLGRAFELLLEAGALDVWCSGVMMKKSRPGQVLSVLCAPEKERELTGLLFAHTSTIGVRRRETERHIMERSARAVATKYGEVMVKDCAWGDVRKTTVEYESARIISETCNIPIDEVYRAAYNGMG